MTPRKKYLIRIAFLAALGLFAVQADLLHRVGEPYPALMMPGFQGSGGGSEDYSLMRRAEAVFVMQNGSRATFTIRELFAPFPVSHHGHLRAYLAPLPEGPPTSRDGLRYRIFPGLHAGLIGRAQPANQQALRRWMRQRAQELLPAADVERLEVIWYRDTYYFSSGKRESEPVGQFTLDLQEPDGA